MTASSTATKAWEGFVPVSEKDGRGSGIIGHLEGAGVLNMTVLVSAEGTSLEQTMVVYGLEEGGVVANDNFGSQQGWRDVPGEEAHTIVEDFLEMDWTLVEEASFGYHQVGPEESGEPQATAASSVQERNAAYRQKMADKRITEAEQERAGFRQWGIGHGDTTTALWLESEDEARATVKQARREGSDAQLVYREVGPRIVEPRPVPERPRARVTDLFEFAGYVEAEGNIWDATRVYGPEMAPGGEFGALWAKAVALVAEGSSVAAEKAVVAVGEFLDEVTEGVGPIWSPRGEVPAMVRCRTCGTRTEMDDPVATVASVTLDDQPAGWSCRDCSEGRRR